MAKVVETSGDDADEAIARALEQLDLSRDQVDVDVVREGRKGFLGLGAEEAIVRVTAKEGAEPASAQRGRRGGRGRGRRGRGGGNGGGGQRAEVADRPQAPGRPAAATPAAVSRHPRRASCRSHRGGRG